MSASGFFNMRFGYPTAVQAVEAASGKLGVQAVLATAGTVSEIEEAFPTVNRRLYSPMPAARVEHSQTADKAERSPCRGPANAVSDKQGSPPIMLVDEVDEAARDALRQSPGDSDAPAPAQAPLSMNRIGGGVCPLWKPPRNRLRGPHPRCLPRELASDCEQVQENPLGSMLIAGAIGFALGLLMTRQPQRLPPPRTRYFGRIRGISNASAKNNISQKER